MYERLLRRSGSVSKPATIAGPSGGRRTSIRPSPTRQRAAGAPSASGNAAAPETARRARIGERFVRAFAAVSLLLLGTLAIALPAQSQTVPSAPLKFTATALATQVDLEWSAPEDDGGSTLVRYEARRAKGASVPDDTEWNELQLNRAFSYSGLESGELYTFELRAVNAHGAGAVARIQATPTSRPTAPEDFSAEPGDAQAVLSWSAPANNRGFAIVRYEVRHVAGASVPKETAWTSVGLVTTHTVTGLANGTQHTFEVRAVNGCCAGDVAQLQATPGGPPTAPQDFTFRNYPGYAALSWSAPADDKGFEILRYEFRAIEGPDFAENSPWISIGLITSGRYDTLSDGTLYTFEVRAVNERGPGAAARLQVTPDKPSVSVEAIQSTVTEGSDVQFRFRRDRDEHLALRLFVDIAGHLKTMSPTTRNLSFSSDTGRDLAVTFEPGQSETTVSLTTEADRVNEGDGEIVVTIQQSPNFYIAGRGKAAVLVEDDDIPEVTLRWVSPAMTLQNNVWVGSMVEGEEIRYEVVCSGNTLIPADLDGRTGADAITQQRIVVRKQENLNHPTFPQYNNDQEFRAPCADSPSMYRLHFGSIRNRFTGPENGEIRIDLLPQLLATSSLYHCYQDSVRHSAQAEDVRFCPKYTLGAVTTARIEVLNRNPTVTVEAVDDEVTEGDPARFRLTRIWTSDWLSPGTLLAASTTIDYTSTAVGSYVPSPPSGQKIFAPTETEVIVEIPTERDGVTGEDGLVTFELLPGTLSTQQSNVGGHYEIYDQLAGVTPPGKSSRVATVRVLNDETGRGVAVSVLALRVPEGESRTYTVALETQPTGPVTVTPSVAGSADVTVSPAALTFTAETWNRAQTVTVSAAQDDDAANDAATVSHAVSGGDYGSVTAPDIAVTVDDDDTRGIEVSASSLTIPEGESRTYTVVLETQPTGPVTVTPSVAGSADVTVSPAALTFTAETWNRAQTVTVSAAQDADAADDAATVSHAVSGGGFDSVTAADVAVTVSDDETASAAVALTVSPGTVDEDAGATTVTVTGTLDGAPRTSETAVTVSVSAGTASAGDFAAVADVTLTIPAGQSSGTATFTLTPVDDAIDEDDETVVVAGTAQALAVTGAAVTVEDDDTRGIEVSASSLTVPEGESRTYTVVLRSQPTGPVTVTPSVTGSPDVTVSGALTFTAATWNRAQTVTVSAAQDVDAANDAATVSHAVSGGGFDSVTAADVAVTVEDDDTRGIEVSASSLTIPEGESRTYTVVLETQPTGPVTVTPSAAGSADVTVSPAALTFTAETWNRAQTVTVSAAQDDDAANDAATVSHAVSGGGFDSVTAADVAVTVSDDEKVSTGVALTVSPGTVDEDAGATTVTVTGTLDGAPRTSETAVTVSVSAGTASAGDFAAVADVTLTIPAGQTSGTATFTLTPVDDAIDEDDETVVVAGTAQALAVTGAAVTVEDDDTRGIEVSASSLTIPEGESRTYTVVLETQPTGPVTVTPSVAGSADVTVSPAALTFTAATWNRAQTVTVSAAQDDDAASDTATVSHAVSGGGFDSVTAADVAVTVSDDETASAAVALTVSPGTVDEDAGATTVTVTGTLDGAPRTSETAVTVSVSAGTASAADFAAVADFTLTIPAGQTSGTATFTLTPVDDSIDEDDETVNVTGMAQSLAVTGAAVEIVDDDGRGVRISPTDLTIPEGESRTYTVVLETQPTGPVTVTPSMTGSPDVTVSGALTFTAETWNRAQTVTVSAAQDADAANDAATVSHAVSGGGYGSVTAADVAVTVEDDDEHGVKISPTDLTIPEGESRTYTVVLETQPTGPLTVTPSAAGDPDVSVSSAALTFTAETWNRAQTVTVSAAHDSDAENDAATVSHAVSGGGYGSATVPDVAVTVEDDDSASTAVALTVSPGTVEEDAGATTVTVTGTLNEATRTSDTAVTVSVSAGTASAADFAAVADFTLTIAAGQTSGSATFTLTPVDDSINEPDETIVVGGTSPGLEVTAATVSIVNADSFPQAWIARFARTVAEQVLEAVDSRMTARSAPGLEVQVAGQRVGNAGPPADGAVQWTGSGRAAGQAFGRNFGGWPGRQDDPALRSGDASRSTMERNLLTGSSFSLTKATDGGGLVSLWGRGALTRFDGREDDVSLDGEVTSGILGADWTWGDATAGMILSHNRGTGSYRGASDSGLVSSFLNGFFPWGRYALNERLTVWGVAGYGVGALTVSPDGEAPVRTDLDLAMFAAGLRGALAQASETAGMDLAWKADGFYARARSAGTHRLPSARAEVTRLRLALEGSRPFRLEGGATLTPSFEIGGRLDGGDAETGLGVDIGGGIAWVHPASGISADLKGRALLTHESLGFSNLGISGSFAWDPDPASIRGPSLTLRQTMGASATGGVDALLGRETLAGLAANDNGNGQQNRRLEIRMGYGFPAFGDRFTSTPELGFAFGESRREYSLGWRLGHGRNGLAPLEFNLEARRSEPVDPGSDPDHSVRFGLTARW